VILYYLAVSIFIGYVCTQHLKHVKTTVAPWSRKTEWWMAGGFAILALFILAIVAGASSAFSAFGAFTLAAFIFAVSWYIHWFVRQDRETTQKVKVTQEQAKTTAEFCDAVNLLFAVIKKHDFNDLPDIYYNEIVDEFARLRNFFVAFIPAYMKATTDEGIAAVAQLGNPVLELHELSDIPPAKLGDLISKWAHSRNPEDTFDRIFDECKDWRAAVTQYEAVITEAYNEQFYKRHLVLGEYAPIDGVNMMGTTDKEHVTIDTHADRFKHTFILGRTGSGKSIFMKSLIIQDMNAGNGVIVISPERDLFENHLLPHIPEDRINDLIYFDPMSTKAPIIGFNPFSFDPPDDPDERQELLAQTASEVYEVINATMKDLGVKMETLLNRGIRALLQRKDASILDFRPLLNPHDSTLRDAIIADTNTDEYTRAFWEEDFENDNYFKSTFSPVMNRLSPFFEPPLSITFAIDSIRWDEQINKHQRIIFFDLSRLRANLQRIVGQLLLSQLKQVLFLRDAMPEKDRLPYFAYLDEAQTYTGESEDDLINFFVRARKYNMGLTLATQNTDNIPPKLRAAMIGNVGTLAALRMGSKDAGPIATDLQFYALKTAKKKQTTGERIEELREALNQPGASYGGTFTTAGAKIQADIEKLIVREREEDLIGTTEEDDPEAVRTLRSDLLQNLPVGCAVVRTPELNYGTPIKIPYIKTPDELIPIGQQHIETSRQNYGALVAQPDVDETEVPETEAIAAATPTAQAPDMEEAAIPPPPTTRRRQRPHPLDHDEVDIH